MIRPFTVVAMLLAAGSGAYLFAVKHHAQMLDDEIADVSQASRLDAQRIRVLQAQWALEIDPTRLQSLAAQFTALQPMQPAQLITLAALKVSLPPAGSAPPGGNPELPGQASPELDAAASQTGDIDADGSPLPPPQPVKTAPAMVAALTPAPKPMVRPAHRVTHAALAGSQLAQALPLPRPFEAPHGYLATALEPAGRAMPMGAQVMSVKASASVPQYTPPAVTADNAGSVLGMAADLPPPQPLQPDTGN